MLYNKFRHLNIVNYAIRAMYSKLGHAEVSSFQRGLHLDDFQMGMPRDLLLRIQYIARKLAIYYRLPFGTAVVRFNDYLESAACIDLTSSPDYFIEVNPRIVRELEDILAVLAHEITHAYLYCRDLVFPDSIDNEILTDTVATYLGLGTLLLNAYAYQLIDQSAQNVITKWYGYISPEEFGYILAKRSQKFSEDPEEHLIFRDGRNAFYSGSALLESEYKLAPLKDATYISRLLYFYNRKRALDKLKTKVPFSREYLKLGYSFECDLRLQVIFKCRLCLQKLRIPSCNELISVRCPTCGASYICRT